ncbi:hypothetical protein [Piscinibacter sp. HJYY11]|uniref:hypothetical protein n=1 Tax=Piscinibacter sp. HJYY11 TaxID=2801333 RepID=UPI00191ED023|nr:hypothetical protein [Piscinibacter sp. HJYY11]MBL0730733.1 hypothetical protein [Piscinibacter sp. HJYY11]
MGEKLSPADLELYQRTDEVLHSVWDPIGVANAPMARDEYHGYLPQVFRLLKEEASAEEIATYLESIATERMGFNANPQQAREVAKLLLEWKEIVDAKHTSSSGRS